MQTVKTSNQHIIFNSDLISVDPNQLFEINFWRNQHAIIGSAQGRGTTWFIQLKKTQAAIRHYKRGGLFGKIISDHYIFTGWHKTRSIAEFHLLNHLISKGVNVPNPIAVRAIKKRFTYQADIISEKIANAQDLVDILETRALSDQQYIDIGKQIKKMHSTQVNHRDLNIHNILLDNENKVWLIDFDNCHIQQGEEWKEANISRLKRSFLKEKKKRNILFEEKNFSTLLAGYEQ